MSGNCSPNVVLNGVAIQATGPRTVIVPADPIEWDESTSYEYLTLVCTSDFGRGYVSKKDVPSGTPLTDTDYWIPVASFNAQLADIQATIAKLNATIDTVKRSTGTINVCDYGADSTGEGDSTSAIVAAAAKATIDDTLFFPSGKYSVSSTIDLSTTNCYKVVGYGAKVAASDGFSGTSVFKLHTVSENPFIEPSITGLYIDAANKVNYCVEASNHHAYVKDMITEGANVADYYTTESNFRIYRCNAKCNPSISQSPCFFKSTAGGDWLLSECNVWGYDTVVSAADGANGVIDMCNFWGFSNPRKVVAVDCPSPYSVVFASNTYFDTINEVFSGCGFNADHCIFFYNTPDKNTLPYHITETSPVTFNTVRISNSNVNVGGEWTGNYDFLPLSNNLVCDNVTVPFTNSTHDAYATQFGNLLSNIMPASTDKYSNVTSGTWYEIGSFTHPSNAGSFTAIACDLFGVDPILVTVDVPGSSYKASPLHDMSYALTKYQLGYVISGNTVKFMAKASSSYLDFYVFSNVLRTNNGTSLNSYQWPVPTSLTDENVSQFSAIG